MPRGIRAQPDEIQHILDLFNDCRKKGRSIMESYRLVGAQVGRDQKVIGTIINRLRPTTDMAKMYLRAKSYRLVKRLVAKAGPSEIIDILQRPSIGVLDPIKKVDSGPGGFFLTVNADSCGAVKVGVMGAHTAQKQLPEATEDEVYNPFTDFIDVGQGAAHAENGDAGDGEADATETRAESVIQRVKRQLAEQRQANRA